MFEKLNLRTRMRKRKQQTAIIALVLMLLGSAIMASVPFAGAATSIKFVFAYNYPLIGINQVWMFGIDHNAGTNVWKNTYGVENLGYVWPEAYLTCTRPDKTNVVLKGPFQVDNFNRRLRGNFTFDQVGTWRVEFVWPGDQYFSPAVVAMDIAVQQAPIPKRDVYAYLSMNPYPNVGLGQDVLINAWVTPPPLIGSSHYDGYLFTFTKPDGSNYKVGPMASELPGTVWFNLPLDQIGTWSIKFDFPGDVDSNPATVTRTINVQQQAVPMGDPDTPLPTDEWTFPVNVFNREWRDIAGPWMMTNYNGSKGAWNPYTEAPKTAHVLWKLPPASGIGGFIGSTAASPGITTTSIYSGSAPNIRTVMAGRGYYTANNIIYCIDMRTGEQLWKASGTFTIGATRNGLPALYQIGNRFIVYDAITGAITLNVTGMAMAASLYEDPYVYTVQDYTGNSEQSYGTTPGTEVKPKEARLIKWTTEGTSTNFASRIKWNVSMPLTGGYGVGDWTAMLQSGLLVVKDSFPTATVVDYWLMAWNTTTGEVAYHKLMSDPTDPSTWVYYQGPASGSGYGKFYYAIDAQENEGAGYFAFDAATGNKAWVSEKTDYPWGAFWAYMPQPCGYGMVFGLSYDGVYAFDVNNGKIVWHYTAEDPNHETPYGQYVFGSVGAIVGGGIVFAPNTEHSPTLYYRGEQLHAIDAFTGKKVWSVLGSYVPTAVAYGTLVAQERTSGYTYGFGKGDTAMTVQTATKLAEPGTPVLIEGTVTDQSPAQQGTPAISDASITAWMEYTHMQQPKPTDATGVPVKLTATDANGNIQDIGTVTSDKDGQFRITWKPATEGTYKISADFEGSESYYASHAGTAVAVSSLAAPTPTPEPVKTINQVSAEAFYAVAFAAFVLIIVVAVLFYRKK